MIGGAEDGVDVDSFDRRAITLRALRGAAAGTRLIDSLTGEVVAEAPIGSGAVKDAAG